MIQVVSVGRTCDSMLHMVIEYYKNVLLKDVDGLVKTSGLFAITWVVSSRNILILLYIQIISIHLQNVYESVVTLLRAVSKLDKNLMELKETERDQIRELLGVKTTRSSNSKAQK